MKSCDIRAPGAAIDPAHCLTHQTTVELGSARCPIGRLEDVEHRLEVLAEAIAHPLVNLHVNAEQPVNPWKHLWNAQLEMLKTKGERDAAREALLAAEDLLVMHRNKMRATEAELDAARKQLVDVGQDLRDLLDALGISGHARSQSPHEVFQECVAEIRRRVHAEGERVVRAARAAPEPEPEGCAVCTDTPWSKTLCARHQAKLESP